MADLLIPLTRGFETVIDEEDYHLVRDYHWMALVNERYDKVYAQGYLKGVSRASTGYATVTMHRLLMNPPPRVPVDHEDHDGLNNRRSNLRISTTAQNAQNSRRPRNKTRLFPYKGVTKSGNRYIGSLSVNRRMVKSASFKTPYEAALAYDVLALEHHGEFAATNASLGLLSLPC